MIKTKWALVVSVVSSVLLTTTQFAHSAGFAIIEQSVSGLGNAYAGGSSATQDASVVYFNPAGMMRLEGRPFIAGFHYIKPSAKFTDKGSTTTTGGNGGDAGQGGVIPNFYYVMDVAENTKFGIGVNVPFGQATEYDKDWVGRYHAVKSAVMAVNINPSIAFNITPSVSFGLGFSLQYLDAELSRALNFGAAGDGFSSMTGDSWSIGYNFGVLYNINKTDIGFSYRSKVKHKLGGDADFTVPEAALTANPALAIAFADTGITANVDLPETASLSATHSFSRQWEIMGDISLTKWSRYSELKVEFDNPNFPGNPAIEENHWNDTWRYSIGANFIPVPAWTLRAGLAYDQGAAPNEIYRSPRVPDTDRTWLALGFGYKVNAKASFDIGYAHLFMDDADIERTSSGDTLKGTYELAIDILSAQFSWVF